MTTIKLTGFPEQELLSLIPALTRFARRFCHNPTDAEDLVHETVCKALANRDKFAKDTCLKSWLFTIMRNTFCTQARKSAREQTGSGDCVANACSVRGDQEWHLEMRQFGEAFSKLSECHQETIRFIVLEGETYEEVAQRHKCPVGTVKSRLNRAREKLAQTVGIDELATMQARTATTGSAWKSR